MKSLHQMTTLSQSIKHNLGIVVVLVFLGTLSMVLASFSEPNPNQGNPRFYVDTSEISQIKEGSLGIKENPETADLLINGSSLIFGTTSVVNNSYIYSGLRVGNTTSPTLPTSGVLATAENLVTGPEYSSTIYGLQNDMLMHGDPSGERLVCSTPEGTLRLCKPTSTPVVDVCTNLVGDQASIPKGYEDPDGDGICTSIVDLCTNISGNQTTMPVGYEDPDQDGVCTAITVVIDLCLNLAGNQTTYPTGYEDLDGDRNCEEIVDLCTNLPGYQTTMPAGYEDPDQDEVCTEIPACVVGIVPFTATCTSNADCSGFPGLDGVCQGYQPADGGCLPGYINGDPVGCPLITDEATCNAEQAQLTCGVGGCSYIGRSCQWVNDNEQVGQCSFTAEANACLEGCTDPTSPLYQPLATVDNGSCDASSIQTQGLYTKHFVYPEQTFASCTIIASRATVEYTSPDGISLEDADGIIDVDWSIVAKGNNPLDLFPYPWTPEIHEMGPGRARIVGFRGDGATSGMRWLTIQARVRNTVTGQTLGTYRQRLEYGTNHQCDVQNIFNREIGSHDEVVFLEPFEF